MKLWIALLLWTLLFLLCWPLAILTIVAFPVIWLVALPFRLLGLLIEGAFRFIRGLVLLPARLLGERVG